MYCLGWWKSVDGSQNSRPSAAANAPVETLTEVKRRFDCTWRHHGPHWCTSQRRPLLWPRVTRLPTGQSAFSAHCDHTLWLRQERRKIWQNEFFAVPDPVATTRRRTLTAVCVTHGARRKRGRYHCTGILADSFSAAVPSTKQGRRQRIYWTIIILYYTVRKFLRSRCGNKRAGMH